MTTWTAGSRKGKALVKEICAKQRHGRWIEHLWHAFHEQTAITETMENTRQGELTMTIFVHHFLQSTVLPPGTAPGDRGGPCAQKKVQAAISVSIARFCAIQQFSRSFRARPVVLLISLQHVCHRLPDLLHRLRQFAARINRRRQCDSTLHGLRNSE